MIFVYKGRVVGENLNRDFDIAEELESTQGAFYGDREFRMQVLSAMESACDNSGQIVSASVASRVGAFIL